jgi:hypothetical protein
MSQNPMSNPKELQPQVPKALIAVLPITRANLNKWGTWLGAGVAALVGTVAVGTALVKEKARRELELGFANIPEHEKPSLTESDRISLKKRNALWKAIMSGNPDHVQQFFSEDPENNMQYIDLVLPSSKLTPLTLAIINGNKDVVEKLLSLGANPRLANALGKTPMQYAAESPMVGIKELFNLGSGGVKRADLQDIIVQGEVDDLDLFFGSSTGNKTYINQVLPSSYLTPLTLAITLGSKDKVDKLLLFGADPELADASGKTPMQYAEKEGNQAIINSLNDAIETKELVETIE